MNKKGIFLMTYINLRIQWIQKCSIFIGTKLLIAHKKMLNTIGHNAFMHIDLKILEELQINLFISLTTVRIFKKIKRTEAVL
jgi:hypothetical protein